MKWKIVVPLVAVIAAGTSLAFVGMRASDPEQVVKTFEIAVAQRDADTLLPLLTLPDELNAHHELTLEQAEAITRTLHEHEQTYQRYLTDLQEQAHQYKSNPAYLPASLTQADAAPSLVVLKKTGKHWLFFDRYQVQVKPMYATLTAPGQAKLVTNEKGVEIEPVSSANLPEGRKYVAGPYFPGNHQVTATLPSPFGEIKKELTFAVDFGVNPNVPVNLDTKEIKIYTNYPNAKLYYQGKPLSAIFEKSWNDYVATIGPAPLQPIELMVKAKTPFGEMQAVGNLEAQEKNLDLPISFATSDELRQQIGKLLLDYNQAWVNYAQSKTSLEQLETYLTQDGNVRENLVYEVESFRDTPEEYKKVFVGKLTGLAADFGSLEMQGEDAVTLMVKETFDDQWKNASSGEITGDGTQILYWNYELIYTAGEWKIANNYEIQPNLFGIDPQQVEKLL
ncbi:TcaA second domain-containing protein [Brevibacillus dissolubilis]|uniref:TcaA second domain-containing protein n=1 Tax=Brevibacillus dissolubilis TaxID=1844116 RepID=UPI001116F578|nr:hypothetical protein [Brevibacillus dissolubilis]